MQKKIVSKRIKLKLSHLFAIGLTFISLQTFANQQLSISTGGTGGVWYPIGGGMASILTKKLPNTSATAEVSGGSVDNIKLLANKKTDMGFTMVDAAWEALNGDGKFKGDKVPLRTLLVVQPLVMHIVTLESTGIKSIADMKGRRISTGSPGSGSEIMAFRILKANGIDPAKDVTRERLSVAEAANALRDRKIDGFMHAAGLPIPSITDISNTPGIKVRLISSGPLALSDMKKEYGPIYSQGTIPAKTYGGQTDSVDTVNVWGILAVNQSMTDKLAYEITKELFANQPELINVHREAANMTLNNQNIGNSPIPFHPGTLKFLAEKGIVIK